MDDNLEEIAIIIDSELFNQIKEVASKQGLSPEQYLVRIAMQYIQKHTPQSRQGGESAAPGRGPARR